MNAKMHPTKFEDSIERHGQTVLWYQANACFCIDNSGRVNPNCPFCYGSGFTYAPVIVVNRIVKGVANGTVTLNLTKFDVNIKTVNRLYVGNGIDKDVLSFTNTTLTLASALPKGSIFYADIDDSMERAFSGECTYLGNGIFKAPIETYSENGIFYGSITQVDSLVNSTRDENVPIQSFWSNLVYTKDKVFDSDTYTITGKYIKPLKFVVQGINPKLKLDNNLITKNADAQCTFPGTYHLGRGDVVVLQKAEIKESAVSINSGEQYKFPIFSVGKILKIEDEAGEITDYTLVNGSIRWGGRKPKRFSVSYTYHPTFSILDDVPSVRYNEDKVFPRKVLLKKFPMFNLPNKLLKPKDANEDLQGLLDNPRSEEEGLI